MEELEADGRFLESGILLAAVGKFRTCGMGDVRGMRIDCSCVGGDFFFSTCR